MSHLPVPGTAAHRVLSLVAAHTQSIPRLPVNLWASLLMVVLATGMTGCRNEIPVEKSSSPATTPEGSTAAPATESSGSGGLKRIIVLTNSASSYWDPCRAGVNDAAVQLKLADRGLTAVMEVNDGTRQGQIDRLRQYGSQNDIAAIGISPIDEANVAIIDELKKLQAKGIPVVTIDSDLNRDKFRDARSAFVGTDNVSGGRVLGQCAKALRPEGGEYASFVGSTGAQNAIDRLAGFAEGAGAEFVSKDTMADDNDRSRARENVRNAIRNHPGLNTLVGIWSYNAPAIVDVVKELKAREKFKVVVFDAEPLTIQAMVDGEVDVMIVQDPYAMGYQGVRLLSALVLKDEAVTKDMLPTFGQPEGDIYDTGLKVIVPNAESAIKPTSLTGKVTFMVLPEFQEWLAKYGLSGS